MKNSSLSSIRTSIKNSRSEFRGLLVHMKKMLPRQFQGRLTELTKKLDRLEAQEGREKPMKCVCRQKFKGFSTWFPHWKSRHPILHKRYSAAKGKKGQMARGNLMLRMMRAASA